MKRILMCLATLCSVTVICDVPGSQDSKYLNRYTASEIINYGTISGSYDFIYAPVDKIKRDVSFESSVRITGSGERVTYEMPRGVSREDAFLWFSSQLDRAGGNLLFQCEGPDCGRATIWASQVFRLRELSAPDRQQTYGAYVLDDSGNQLLFAVYVVERGNKRVIAHIEQVQPETSVSFDENRGFGDQLATTGIAVVHNVEPDREGALNDQEKGVIMAISEQLGSLVSPDVYVVCHVYAAGNAGPLIEASQKCADAVSDQISNETSLKPVGLGAGPLMPVEGRKPSRVEIVVPSLLRQVSR